MRVLILTVLALTAVSAAPKTSQRIVGGQVTTINNYPYIAALLANRGPAGHRQECGGSIINNRSVLTAAHCTIGDAPHVWRTRAGSTNSNSGGVVYNTNLIINHPQYNPSNFNNDVAIIRTASMIHFNNVIRPASIAGQNYHIGDNQVVWAAGWGATGQGAPFSEQLRHVQVWTVNQAICRQRYGNVISDNMLCAGWLDVGGRDSCQGDSGGPLYHNRVVVGISSFGTGCGNPRFPGVYARVPRFAQWISNNA